MIESGGFKRVALLRAMVARSISGSMGMTLRSAKKAWTRGLIFERKAVVGQQLHPGAHAGVKLGISEALG
jgi:hypothetical protein